MEDGNLVNEKVAALGARVQEEGQAKTGGPESNADFFLVLVHVDVDISKCLILAPLGDPDLHYHLGAYNQTAR